MPYSTESQELTTADLARDANAREANQPADWNKSEERAEPLFPREACEDMRTKWEKIQTEFVDDPQASVKEADSLVASAIKRLAETFADERAKLEQQWSKGNDVSTEDLRQALRRYRSFFHRLLNI